MTVDKEKPRGIPFAAMLGDGSPKARADFERSARMALKHPNRLQPGLKETLERYLENPIRAAAQEIEPAWIRHEIEQLLVKFRQGRPESAATAHIRQLVTKHPGLKPAALRKFADESVLQGTAGKPMTKEVFRKHVAAARRK